jgi:hypothetical protein
MECWRRSFSFKGSDLLAKGEDLKSRIGPTAEEDANHGNNSENVLSHEMKL